MEKIGIDGIWKVIDLALSLHQAYDKANADGKINFLDAPLLMKPALKIIPAVQAASMALKEIKDLDDLERADLLQRVKSSYDIADDIVEKKVEDGLDLVLHIAQYVGAVV